MTETARYRNPTPTVDAIIEIADRPGTVVLIERGNEPRGWALPGGFVEAGEWVIDAAIREAKEETGLDIAITELFHVYSDPHRDPRQHTLSTVFLATATGAPIGGDDAQRAGVFALAALPSPIAFDHATMLADYIEYRSTGRRPPARR
jgi:8-oxo-dGTP diphosphatase